jgi:DNA-binding LytR/AlgR family response regulator
MVRLLIADDNKGFRESLKHFLLTHFNGQYEIVSEVRSRKELGRVLQEPNATKRVSFDLALLDMDLNDGLAIDVLNEMSALDFAIVFITAHDSYAIDAVRFAPLGYIRKPISTDEYRRVLSYAFRNTERTAVNLANYETLENNESNEGNERTESSETSDRLGGGADGKLTTQNALDASDTAPYVRTLQPVPDARGVVTIKPSEHIITLRSLQQETSFFCDAAMYFEADKHYCHGVFCDNSSMFFSHSLAELESLLAPFGLARISRTHLVNLAHIRSFAGTNRLSSVQLFDDQELSVSPQLREKIETQWRATQRITTGGMDYFVLRSSSAVERVALHASEIYLVEAAYDTHDVALQAILHCSNGRVFKSYQSHSQWQAELEPNDFCLVNRGVLVSLAEVKEWRKDQHELALTLYNGALVRVSRYYRDGFLERFERFPRPLRTSTKAS